MAHGLQEDIYITGKESVHPSHAAAGAQPHGAALTAHNLAQLLHLPGHYAEQPGGALGLHRDSCGTMYNDESWQARAPLSPRWLPESPRSATPALSPASSVSQEAAVGAGAGAGECTADNDSTENVSSPPAAEQTTSDHADASGVMLERSEDTDAPEQAEVTEPDTSSEDAAGDAVGSEGAAQGRAELKPVHTVLFRPSAGAGTMPSIAEAGAQTAAGDAPPAPAPSAATRSAAAARLARKSKRVLRGGTVRYHDGRPKLGALFDEVEAAARSAGSNRVAVLICGNKHLLRNCLRLVGERQTGDVHFEAHYESFGFV